MTTDDSWQEQIFQTLKASDINIVAHVPDAGHAHVIRRAEDDSAITAVALTTEEEGVALLAGADLGLQRAVLLLQSSGIGNCVNFFSFATAGRFPLLMLVSMRGELGEGNPWQYPMGQAVEPVCHAMGILTERIEQANQVVPRLQAAITSVFQGGNSVAVLLTQQLIGAKAF